MAEACPYLKMEFCCGTWMEGLRLPTANSDDGNSGDGNLAIMGCFGEGKAGLLDPLRQYIQANRVAIVHLRNCTAPLPQFAETYIDDGFMDVGEIVQVLVECGYNGTVILDHTPPFEGDGGEAAATAFSIG